MTTIEQAINILVAEGHERDDVVAIVEQQIDIETRHDKQGRVTWAPESMDAATMDAIREALVSTTATPNTDYDDLYAAETDQA